MLLCRIEAKTVLGEFVQVESKDATTLDRVHGGFVREAQLYCMGGVRGCEGVRQEITTVLIDRVFPLFIDQRAVSRLHAIKQSSLEVAGYIGGRQIEVSQYQPIICPIRRKCGASRLGTTSIAPIHSGRVVRQDFIEEPVGIFYKVVTKLQAENLAQIRRDGIRRRCAQLELDLFSGGRLRENGQIAVSEVLDISLAFPCAGRVDEFRRRRSMHQAHSYFVCGAGGNTDIANGDDQILLIGLEFGVSKSRYVHPSRAGGCDVEGFNIPSDCIRHTSPYNPGYEREQVLVGIHQHQAVGELLRELQQCCLPRLRTVGVGLRP